MRSSLAKSERRKGVDRETRPHRKEERPRDEHVQGHIARDLGHQIAGMQAGHADEREGLKHPRSVAQREQSVDDDTNPEQKGHVARRREPDEERELVGTERPEEREVVGEHPVVGIERFDLAETDERVANQKNAQNDAK